MDYMNKGNSNTEAFMILAVLIVITLVTYNKSPGTTSNGFLAPPTNNTYTSPANSAMYNLSSQPTSSYSQNIYINTGNAAYAYQSYEEYITISNFSGDSVDITGWQLKNGKNERAYDLGGALRYFPSDTAVIPRATRFISPSGNSPLENVVLKQGETAIITTGTANPQYPFRITSFKENICSGYIENLPEYNFTPSLSYNCPRPATELGVSGLSSECRQFIERMSSCRTPEFDTRTPDGEICHNCVDRTPVLSSCLAFIKSHFSYNGCIANHLSDPNFSLNTWRVFLGKGWEMWAQKYETIELFDQLGRLVKRQTY